MKNKSELTLKTKVGKFHFQSSFYFQKTETKEGFENRLLVFRA